MIDEMTWYEILLSSVTALWTVITVIVAATDGKTDDNIVRVIADVISALQAKNAAGTLKLPGTRSKVPESPDMLYIQRVKDDGAVVSTSSYPPAPEGEK